MLNSFAAVLEEECHGIHRNHNPEEWRKLWFEKFSINKKVLKL